MVVGSSCCVATPQGSGWAIECFKVRQPRQGAVAADADGSA